MKTNVIITGATGMVGEGVLLECLADPDIERVLVVGRRSCGYTHVKLSELICADLSNPLPAAGLQGFDSCFFCAGVSSIGKSEEEYHKLTYNIAIGFAKVFMEQNPGYKFTFCYVSGYGTDSSEQGKSMWARVKGKTENKLLEMFPGEAYMFRPGYMKPVKGQRNILKFYLGWQLFYPLIRTLLPKFACTLQDVGKAMINCSRQGYKKNILEVKDIVEAASLSK
jgi:hypothetical protein